MTERHAPILAKGFWEAHTAALEASLQKWLKAASDDQERIVVRHNRAGKVVAVGRFKGGLISSDRFEVVHQAEPFHTEQPVDPGYAASPPSIV